MSTELEHECSYCWILKCGTILLMALQARKALCALKGLVKLQALVRGHLVRKQATATLRCMQALVTAQARALAQRVRVVDDTKPPINHRPSTAHRKSVQDNWLRNPYHVSYTIFNQNFQIHDLIFQSLKKFSLFILAYRIDPFLRKATHCMPIKIQTRILLFLAP